MASTAGDGKNSNECKKSLKIKGLVRTLTTHLPNTFIILKKAEEKAALTYCMSWHTNWTEYLTERMFGFGKYVFLVH